MAEVAVLSRENNRNDGQLSIKKKNRSYFKGYPDHSQFQLLVLGKKCLVSDHFVIMQDKFYTIL